MLTSFPCPHSAATWGWSRNCGNHGSCRQSMLLPASFNIRAHHSGTPVLEGSWEDPDWLSLSCSLNWGSSMRHRLTEPSAGIPSHWRLLGWLHHHREDTDTPKYLILAPNSKKEGVFCFPVSDKYIGKCWTLNIISLSCCRQCINPTQCVLCGKRIGREEKYPEQQMVGDVITVWAVITLI